MTLTSIEPNSFEEISGILGARRVWAIAAFSRANLSLYQKPAQYVTQFNRCLPKVLPSLALCVQILMGYSEDGEVFHKESVGHI